MKDKPAGWERVTLREVCSVGKDKGIPSQTSSLPFIGMEHVQSDTGRVLQFAESLDYRSTAPRVQSGNVLYGRLRPYLNKIFVADRETFVSGEFIPLVVGERIDSRFLMYRLLSPDFVSFAVGLNAGDRPRVKWPQIAEFPLVLPPLDEQQRIVATLEDHLSRLDMANASLAKARLLANSLIKAAVLATIPSTLPSHWTQSTVGEVGDSRLGRQRHPDWHTGPNMRPYLRVANVFEDRIDTSDVMEMDFSGCFEDFRLLPGDVLLNEGQSPHLLGRPAIYRGVPEDVAFTNSLIRFRPGPSVLPEWALLVFRHHMHSRRFMRESRITTNIAHLSLKRLLTVEFPVPPLEEQRQIVERLRLNLEEIERLSNDVRRQVAEAASLRRSLLASAFTGQLTKEPIGV